MDYTTLMSQLECLPHLKEIDAQSLYATFEQIQDGRCKRGIRYPLALLLSLIVLAKLAGMDNMNGVVEWVRHRHAWLNAIFGTSYRRWPCFSTYVYALSKLDAQVASFLLSSALSSVSFVGASGCHRLALLSPNQATIGKTGLPKPGCSRASPTA